MGSDLDEAFHAVLPGRPLAKVSAALPYDQMVEAAKHAGRLAALLELEPEAVEAAERLLGKGVAERDIGLGKYAQAGDLLSRVLPVLEETSGAEGSAYQMSLHDLAGLFQGRGDYAEAERIYRQLMSAQESALGKENPALRATLADLAITVALQGRLPEGEVLARRSVQIAEKTCGARHFDTANSLYVLAQLEARNGNVSAPETARWAVTALARTLGSNHPTSKAAAALVEQLGGR
jgi:tetratricopeptide (TPR) repeat protein